MEQYMVGVDLVPLGVPVSVIVLLEGSQLDVSGLSCCVKPVGKDWEEYPLVEGSPDGVLGEDDNLVRSLKLASAGVSDIQKLQDSVEAAGYQWCETSRRIMEHRVYEVNVTRSGLHNWTKHSPNVEAVGPCASRLECWQQVVELVDSRKEAIRQVCQLVPA